MSDVKKLNLLDLKEKEIVFEEYLHGDSGTWEKIRSFQKPSDWEICVEIPRNASSYRYFLCQDNPVHISIRRMKK